MGCAQKRYELCLMALSLVPDCEEKHDLIHENPIGKRKHIITEYYSRVDNLLSSHSIFGTKYHKVRERERSISRKKSAINKEKRKGEAAQAHVRMIEKRARAKQISTDPEYYIRCRERDHRRQPQKTIVSRIWWASNPHLRAKYAKDRIKKFESLEALRDHDRMVHNKWKDRNPSYYPREQANRRGITWMLSEETADQMCLEACGYCGGFSDYGKRNGLDRIDNSGIYEEGNVTPCCPTCNHMKSDDDIETFLARIHHLNNCFTGGHSEPEFLDLFPTAARASFNNYVSRSQSMGFEFPMTQEDFSLFVRQPCTYCNRPCALGIDRIDNSTSYLAENICPCCATCNYLKYNMTVEAFENRVKKIAAVWPLEKE